MSKPYAVRKMGTRAGSAHYGAECKLCRAVLVVAHLGKDAATDIALAHVRRLHPAHA